MLNNKCSFPCNIVSLNEKFERESQNAKAPKLLNRNKQIKQGRMKILRQLL